MLDLTARYCLLHFKMATLDFLTTKSGPCFLSWSVFLICHQENWDFIVCLVLFIHQSWNSMFAQVEVYFYCLS